MVSFEAIRSGESHGGILCTKLGFLQAYLLNQYACKTSEKTIRGSAGTYFVVSKLLSVNEGLFVPVHVSPIPARLLFRHDQ
jgi:hypothetical protein